MPTNYSTTIVGFHPHFVLTTMRGQQKAINLVIIFEIFYKSQNLL